MCPSTSRRREQPPCKCFGGGRGVGRQAARTVLSAAGATEGADWTAKPEAREMTGAHAREGAAPPPLPEARAAATPGFAAPPGFVAPDATAEAAAVATPAAEAAPLQAPPWMGFLPKMMLHPG